MSEISISELSSEIERALSDYGRGTADEVKKEVKTIASQTVQRLKSTSPKKSGKYASGWTETVAYEDKESIRVNIHNKKKPSLTHLLENGHAKLNGGRVEGIPHIGPAEEAARRELDGRIKVVLKG